MPGEILDKIFASPELNLRDHLSLAASCKSFRACYYTLKKSNTPKKIKNTLWEALIVLRPPASTSTSRVTAPPSAPTADHHRLIKHIFTNEDKVGLDEMRVLWPKARGGAVEPKRTGRTQAEKRDAAKEQVPGGAMRSVEWEEAIDLVHNTRVTATEAMKTYKLSKKELEPLPHLSRPNPHGGRSSGPMRLFVEAAVESRALRLHGGVWGHEQLLEKREATRQKAANTRAARGTKMGRPKKAKTSSYYGYGGYPAYGHLDYWDMF